jgi:hypothetical protein
VMRLWKLRYIGVYNRTYHYLSHEGLAIDPRSITKETAPIFRCHGVLIGRWWFKVALGTEVELCTGLDSAWDLVWASERVVEIGETLVSMNRELRVVIVGIEIKRGERCIQREYKLL